MIYYVCMYVFLSVLLVVPYVGLWTAIVESPDHIQLLFFLENASNGFSTGRDEEYP